MSLGIGIGLAITRGGGAGTAADAVLAAFADGTDGFYFDFSKTDQLFQETIGVTPADGSGENIGLALESHAWAGKTLAQIKASQPELRPVGAGDDNDTGTGVSTDDGTTISLNGSSSANRAKRGWALTGLIVGASYEVAFNATSVSGAGGVGLSVVANSGATNLDILATSAGSYRYVYTATATSRLLLLQTSASGALASIPNASVSIKLLPGNHGSQATAAAQPKWQTGGLARFDGADDALQSTLMPDITAGTLMAKVLATDTAGNKIIIGAGIVSAWCAIEVRSSGEVGGRLGSSSSTVITGGASVEGMVCVIAMTYDASTVKLYRNGVEVYSGARSGNPTTTSALALGGVNNAGAITGLFAGDLYYALAIKKALSTSEIQAITNQWGAT